MSDMYSQNTIPVSYARSAPGVLRFFTVIALLLLAVLFMDGTLLNLYVHVPATHPGQHAASLFTGAVQVVQWAILSAPRVLQIEMIAGLVLLLVGLILFILSIIMRRAGWIILSLIGLIGVVGAGYYAISFMNYGPQSYNPLGMAAGFLLAAIFYTIGLAFAR
jgi:1,4-dihydroxy-2-naphthoate octaprenyltransferase